MARVGYLTHSDFLQHETGRSHPESPQRLIAIQDHLQATGLLTRLVPLEPRSVLEEDLLRVHRAAYLKHIEETIPREGLRYLDPDTPVGPQSYQVALLACGGVLSAVDAVMAGDVAQAFCALRPPGHHAEGERAMGFCLVNHVAVAARYLQVHHGLPRILVVDWDVHHGNGTQAIFYEDPSIFYLGLHQFPLYPGTGSARETGAGPGTGFTLNIPLPAGSGDAAYRKALAEALTTVEARFAPSFILVSAGFDAHREDPLAGMRVTEAGFRQMTERLREFALRHSGGRLVSVLEGGYDLQALGRSVAAHLGVLLNAEVSQGVE